MSKDKIKRNLMNSLIIQFDCKCHWCGCEVFRGKVYHAQHNQATIDHLMTKRMGRKKYLEGGHVLACFKCNNAREKEETRQLHEHIDYDRYKNLCHLALRAENPPSKGIEIKVEQIALDWQTDECYNTHIATHYII